MKRPIYSGIYIQRANPESPSFVGLDDKLVKDSDKEYESYHKRLFSSINKIKLNKSIGSSHYGFRGRRFAINGSYLEHDSVGRNMAYIFYTTEQAPAVVSRILTDYSSKMNMTLPDKAGKVIEGAFRKRKAQQLFQTIISFVIIIAVIIAAILALTWKH